MIHVTPPQSAPDFIKQSPLANKVGWMDVHPNTLQSTKYANIIFLCRQGDAVIPVIRSTKKPLALVVGKKIGFPWLYWHLMLKGYRIDIPASGILCRKVFERRVELKSSLYAGKS